MRPRNHNSPPQLVGFCVLICFGTLFWRPWKSRESGVAPVLHPGHQQTQLMPVSRKPVSPDHVLVVMNVQSPDSRAIADRYIEARHIPSANVLRISCSQGDEWGVDDYRSELESFVQERAEKNSALDYVVLTRGIPFRFSDYGSSGGYSTDSVLGVCMLSPRPDPRAANPYYKADETFSRARFGTLLVTRLDGPTRQSALREVDSALSAKPVRGPFYLRDSFIESMEAANSALVGRGMTTEWVKGFNNPDFPRYEGQGGPYMAHWGAGPHDTQYTPEKYARMKFLPGAICDITWSASAAGLRDIKSNGNIAVMTENGAAGAQGYVSEPFSDALSKPEIVLDRYANGYNLAESFSMGTPYVNWKSLVLGDPLCAPLRRRSSENRPGEGRALGAGRCIPARRLKAA